MADAVGEGGEGRGNGGLDASRVLQSSVPLPGLMAERGYDEASIELTARGTFTG